jgi:uracil-DNA glycosylase
LERSSGTFESDLAALAWLIELGADEAISSSPVNRFEETPAPCPVPAKPSPVVEPNGTAERPQAAFENPGEGASATHALVSACADLASLRAELERFEGCTLKKGARSTVFSDGNPAARVMIIGEAPGSDEDRTGLPFVGRSGQLLDRMLAAINLSRHADDPGRAVYITNVLPWRPPQNREPAAGEVAMLLPFLHRHIELADPDVLILMGNAAVKTLLETSTGITRMRGAWAEWRDRPVMPMFHPAALLRDPEKKRHCWADLLKVRARLERS